MVTPTAEPAVVALEPVAPDAPPRRFRLSLTPSLPRRMVVAGALAALLTVTLVLRLAVLAEANWVIDGDEAVVGVMAQDILSGRFPVFFYGQVYLGALEAYLVAPVFALLGPSAVALKLVPALFGVAHVGVLFLLADRMFGLRVALIAGLLAAVPPLYLAVNSSRALGGYPETLFFGDLLLLGAVAADRYARQRSWWFLGLGIIAGLAVWTHLLVLHYLLPAAAFLLLREPSLPRRLAFWCGILGAVIGSAPLWWYNLANNWATVQYFVAGAGQGGAIPVLTVLRFWMAYPLAYALGVAQPWPGDVPLSPMLLGLLCLAAVLWLTDQALRYIRWKRPPGQQLTPAVLLLLFALGLPALYLASGYGAWAHTNPTTDFTGRYLLPVATLAPLLLGGLVVALGRISAFLAAGALAFLLTANAGTYQGVDYRTVFQSPYFCCWAPLPSNHADLIESLQQRGIELVITNHWVGHRLIFESQRALPAFDYFDVAKAGGADRFPEYHELQDRTPAPKIAIVLVRSPGEERLYMDDWLDELDPPYERYIMEPYVVYVPTTAIDLDVVAEALAYPY